jgi:hypothetical protein
MIGLAEHPERRHVVISMVICLACGFSIYVTQKLHQSPTPPPSSPREVWILYFGTFTLDKSNGTWGILSEHGVNVLQTALSPEIGAYSSHDRSILKQHIAMIRSSGVDVIVFPWLGIDKSNRTGTYSDTTLKLLLPIAASARLRVLPLIVNYKDRTTAAFERNLDYWQANYGNFAGQYKFRNKPAFIVYDAFEWSDSWRVLPKYSGLTFFATANSRPNFQRAFEDGHTGLLTFFASDANTWGSNSENWKDIARLAADRGLLFVPAVSPGYNEMTNEKWRLRLAVARGCSERYARQWRAAMDVI